jgi:hypothetical protein
MEITRRSYADASAFAVVLGAGCARAAGVPPVEEMARELFTGLETASPDLTAKYLAQRGATNEAIVDAFYEFLADLPHPQRAALILQFIASVPVPLFYQDLAALVRSRYFSCVLTTNVDTLFEQALVGAGLRRGRDFRVITLDDRPRSGDALSEDGVTVLKLHGDVSQRQFAITPDEITQLLERQRPLVKGTLGHDLLMVGYEFECPPLTEGLARVPGELWWVSPDPPNGDAMEGIDLMRHLTCIDGVGGTPEVFFGELSMLLLQMPAMNAMAKSFEAVENGDPSLRLSPVADITPPDDGEAFQREYLIGQLRRCEDLLRKLQLQAVPGDANKRLRQQIRYQKKELARLEARLRSLSSVREKILELLQEIDRDATGPGIRSDEASTAAAFLHRQVELVRAEYAGNSPNEDVVSATLAATIILADRLDVPAKLLRELGHFGARSMVRADW